MKPFFSPSGETSALRTWQTICTGTRRALLVRSVLLLALVLPLLQVVSLEHLQQHLTSDLHEANARATRVHMTQGRTSNGHASHAHASQGHTSPGHTNESLADVVVASGASIGSALASSAQESTSAFDVADWTDDSSASSTEPASCTSCLGEHALNAGGFACLESATSFARCNGAEPPRPRDRSLAHGIHGPPYAGRAPPDLHF